MTAKPDVRKPSTPRVYEQAQLVAEGFLIAAAQARRLVTHAELTRAVQGATEHRFYRSSARFLRDLDYRTQSKYGVLLSTLLVHSTTFQSDLPALARTKPLAQLGETEVDLDHRLRGEVFKRFAG